jgi:hypothetical protein
MQIRKKGDEIKNKSSPLKLLSQSQTNFAEIFRGEDFFKFSSPFFLICIIGQIRQKFKVHNKSRNIWVRPYDQEGPHSRT